MVACAASDIIKGWQRKEKKIQKSEILSVKAIWWSSICLVKHLSQGKGGNFTPGILIISLECQDNSGWVYKSEPPKLYVGIGHWVYVGIRHWVLRENHMVDRCVRKDSSSCDPSHITRDCRWRVMRLGSQREESVLMHLSTIWFSFHAMVLLNLCI